jgi:hypothetical protein
MSDAIETGVPPKVELDQEKITFTTSDGKTFAIAVRSFLEDGDTAQALAFAQLLLLRTISEGQSELARAMTDMANAVGSLASPKSSLPPEVIATKLVEPIMGKITEMMSANKG